MGRFRFRLQPLVEVRKAARDACRAELAAALADAERLAAKRLELVRALAREQAQLEALRQSGPTDVARLQARAGYQAALRSRLVELAGLEASTRAQVDSCQQSLADAERALCALSRLRQRRLEEFRQTLAARERRQLDEAAARQFELHAASGDLGGESSG
jgi:flagellar export protein FliJ